MEGGLGAGHRLAVSTAKASSPPHLPSPPAPHTRSLSVICVFISASVRWFPCAPPCTRSTLPRSAPPWPSSLPGCQVVRRSSSLPVPRRLQSST